MRQTHLGIEHKDTLATLNNLAVTLKAMNRLDEAEEQQRQSLQGRARLFGEDDFRTITSLNNLASLVLSRGDFEEAERLFQETVERLERTRGPVDEYTLTARIWRGYALAKLDRLTEAEAVQRAAVEAIHGNAAVDPKIRQAAFDAYIFTLRLLNKLDEVEPLQRELISMMEQSGGTSHPRYSRIVCQLGVTLQQRGEVEEAKRLLEGLLDKYLDMAGRTMLPAETVRATVNDWVVCLSEHDGNKAAVSKLRVFVQRTGQKLGENHWLTMIVDYNLAIAIINAEGTTEDARRLLQDALRLATENRDSANYQVLGDRIQNALRQF